MGRYVMLVGTILLVACTAAAQDRASKTEFFLGYDFLRANSAADIPAFSANGGGGQFAYNLNSWLGAAADVYAVHNRHVFSGVKIDNTSLFYQFGPRVSIRKWSRITPFVQMLVGGHTLRSSASRQQTQFAYLLGGGVDIRLSKHTSFRPIGADLQFTRLEQLQVPNTQRSQYNFRYSAGVNFTFGGAQ